MKNAMMVATLCTMASLSSFGQCASNITVEPVNMWDDVFTYEVNEVFNDECHYLINPVRVDSFSWVNVKGRNSTFIITVTDRGETIDRFVLTPGTKDNGCASWVPNQTKGNLTTLTIK